MSEIFIHIRGTKLEFKKRVLTKKIFTNKVRFINCRKGLILWWFIFNEHILNQMNLLQLTSFTNHASKAQVSYRPSDLERCVC